MRRVRRTVPARRDYLQIWLYIAENSIAAADRTVEEFDEKLRLLAQFPGLGQSRDDLEPSVRSYPVGNYLLFYRPVKGGIELVRVLHGARNLRRAFNSPGRPRRKPRRKDGP
jgi:toxin ParE1/3/4